MNKEELKRKFGIGTTESTEGDNNDTKKSAANQNKEPHENKFYGVDLESAYVTSLKLVFRSAEVFYMPYALQPIIHYKPDSGISIKLLDQQIEIKGRNLDQLLDMLGNQRVTWIKESPTGKDDGTEGVFVKGITINQIR